MQEIFLKKPAKEWLPLLEAANILAAHVQTLAEATEDPQAVANGYIVEQDYPGHGKVKVVGMPIHFNKMPIRPGRASPELGEHTHEILLDLGYSWEDIAQLVAEEVIE